MSGSFWAGTIPPWAWVLYVCAAALFIILVLLAELHGRGVGERRAEEDREEAGAWLRELAGHPDRTTRVLRPRGERTSAFLNPLELHHEEPQPFADPYGWLDHTDQAMDLANDDPTVSAWTQQMAESMDAWLEAHVYSVPIPYLPGEDRE